MCTCVCVCILVGTRNQFYNDVSEKNSFHDGCITGSRFSGGGESISFVRNFNWILRLTNP